jgi:hypothetical protein
LFRLPALDRRNWRRVCWDIETAATDDGCESAVNAPDCRHSLTFREQHLKGSMSTTDRRIAQMTFASVYPMYVAKVKRKGRDEKELRQVIKWLTGFDSRKLQGLIKANVTFEIFFKQASLNPNARLITGVICGYRVEEIKDPLTRKVRYLDKLVDELANGRAMEKILRTP